jgi:hypothetical protein
MNVKGTKAQKRARIGEMLNSQSDDDLAALLQAAVDLMIEGVRRHEQERGMTAGETIVARLSWGYEDDILDFPLRGRRVREWLPRSYYIPRSGGGGRGLPPGYVCRPLPVERIWWDIPLDAKLSIGQRIYNGCKAAEEACSNDDTRVATLLAEAQLEMLRDPFAAFASLRSGNEPPPSRAQRIEALVEFFEMMMPGRRSGGRGGAWGRVPDHIKEQYGCCLPATRTLM